MTTLTKQVTLEDALEELREFHQQTQKSILYGPPMDGEVCCCTGRLLEECTCEECCAEDAHYDPPENHTGLTYNTETGVIGGSYDPMAGWPKVPTEAEITAKEDALLEELLAKRGMVAMKQADAEALCENPMRLSTSRVLRVTAVESVDYLPGHEPKVDHALNLTREAPMGGCRMGTAAWEEGK